MADREAMGWAALRWILESDLASEKAKVSGGKGNDISSSNADRRLLSSKERF